MNPRFTFTFACTLLLLAAEAQLPVVDQPILYSPAQSIYMSPAGNDANSGTMGSPLKTFYAALTHINWGVVSVNGGNAYAEVVLLPGEYYPTGTNSLAQYQAQWRQGTPGNYVYKNVSIRGVGNVHIHGDSLTAGNQMIYLMGSHIKVSNLYISNCPLHGVYIDGSPITHHSDVLIDSVSVDTAFGFGIYASGYDRVMAQHCYVNESCRQNANEINGTCQWPSGLRTDDCWHVTFRNNTVCHNWGEGVNTSYARYADVSDNIVYDNYSVNIYCHSSSLVMYHNNLVYNSDSTFWRYCYGSGGASASGISIANELSCTSGCAFTNSCGSSVSCCSFTDIDHSFNTAVNYYQTDSMFVYNNIFLECGINIWDAFSGFGNYAYMNHLYIEQNTIIGKENASALVHAPITISLGTNFIYFANMRVRNNIIAVDNSLPNYSDFYSYVAGPCNGTWTNNISFSGNLWHILPTTPGVNFTADQVSSALPLHAVVGDTANLKPSPQHPELVLADPSISYITDDYYHHPRMANTNAGAVEYDVANGIQDGMNAGQPFLFPDPAKDEFTLHFSDMNSGWAYEVRSAATGQLILEGRGESDATRINTSEWADGIYSVSVLSNGQTSVLKLVLCR